MADVKKGILSLRGKIIKRLFSFIPKRTSNYTVVNAFDILRNFQKIRGKKFDNLSVNIKNFKGHEAAILSNKGYIEDQNKYADMKYGKATVKHSGCGIIATYNALFNIHGQPLMTLSELIKEFEADGIVFNGKLGTAPNAAFDFFKRKGYSVKVETDERLFDEIGEKFHSFILTMYNDASDISRELHSINISKDNEGRFHAHNAYCSFLAKFIFSRKKYKA